MKQPACFTLSITLFVAGLLAAPLVSALAQDQESQAAKKIAEKMAIDIERKISDDAVKLIGAKIGFETKVVKGAPYSATAEAETVQTLADGNRIRTKTTTLVYRNGDGRTRREVMGKAPSAATEVFISDPATGVNYSLDTRQRLAHKFQINPSPLEVEKMRLKRELDMKRPAVENEPGPRIVAKKKKRAPTVESLGQQMIEGVLCEGRRATSIIPVEEVGNELPITIVNEQWYSPELQVYVLTRQSDPRTGETIYRLTNINRGEPGRELFEVPADYTLKDESAIPPIKAKRRPEEEQ
ncbi:MAG TPA: hypothetical protein VFS27_01425 [Blastocatellia bacterium]|nr:hypothetical protein [Blastocatellia bacterium]